MSKQGWEQAEQRVRTATYEDLSVIWKALGELAWDGETQSSYEGVSMDDWAQLVKSELERRGQIPNIGTYTGICCTCQNKVPCSFSHGTVLTIHHEAFGQVCAGSDTVPQVAWNPKGRQVPVYDGALDDTSDLWGIQRENKL